MSRPAATLPWTTDDFLAWEREQPERYEWDGRNIVAMTGGRVRNVRVAGNLYRALFDRVPAGCTALTEGVKILAGVTARVPDLLVVCNPELDLDADVIDDATLIVEIISPSTALIDRTEKVVDYAHVPSLEAYLIIDPARRQLELYRREDGRLVPAPAAEVAGDTVALFGSVVVPVDAIYEGVLESSDPPA